MRTLVLAFLLAAALPSGHALARQGGEAVSTEAARRADAAVLRHSASILGVPVDKLRLERSYARQVVAGDALDVIEIIMAIEEDLDIAIDDAALDVSAGASGVEDIAERLTIARLQQVVRNVLARRPGKSFKPKPPGGSVQPRR
jgi:acyl carrier protein